MGLLARARVGVLALGTVGSPAEVHLQRAMDLVTQIPGVLVHLPRKTMVLVTQIHLGQAQVILDFALISIAIKEDVKDSK